MRLPWLPLRIRDSAINARFVFDATPMAPSANSRLCYQCTIRFRCDSYGSLCEFETLLSMHDSFSMRLLWLPLRIRDSAINARFVFDATPMAPSANSKLCYQCMIRFRCDSYDSLCEFETLLSMHDSFSMRLPC